MTEPELAKRVKLNNSYTRKYSWPPNPPHEFTVTSVTTAINGGLPKPFLVGWASKITAECAVADHDIVSAMLKKGDKRAAIQHVKGARNRYLQDKADRGNIVHSALESYMRGKPLTEVEVRHMLDETHVPDNMRPTTAGMIAGLMEFLWDTEPEIVWSEDTVYNRTHKYAGTPDVVAYLQVDGKVRPAIIDVKTAKQIYDEVALQMVAYARAEFVGKSDGSELPMLPSSEPILHGIVVRPISNGTYERADFELGDDVFEMFLHCLGVTEATDEGVLENARIYKRKHDGS